MKNLNKNIIIGCLMLTALPMFSVSELTPAQQNHSRTLLGANPYTWSPKIFNAENGVSGRYWVGNKTKQYPGKAFIQDIEYKDIVVIRKSKLNTKLSKKLKKHKEYLGSYIDAQTNIEYYLYGVKKNPDPVDDAPDADVITKIAIDLDYGIGE